MNSAVQFIYGTCACIYGLGILVAGLRQKALLARGEHIQGEVTSCTFKTTLYWPTGVQRVYTLKIATDSAAPLELHTTYHCLPGQPVSLVRWKGDYHLSQHVHPTHIVIIGGALVTAGVLFSVHILTQS